MYKVIVIMKYKGEYKMFLDIKTLTVIQLIVNVILIFFFYILRFYSDKVKASNFWVASYLSLLFGFLQVMLRGKIPDFFSYVVGNGMIFLCFSFFYTGIRHFFNKKTSIILTYILPLICMGLVFRLME